MEYGELYERFRNADEYFLAHGSEDDALILKNIAIENARTAWADNKKWFCIYTLQHRASYSEMTTIEEPVDSHYCVIENKESGGISIGPFDQALQKWSREQDILLNEAFIGDLSIENTFPKFLKDTNGQELDDTFYQFGSDLKIKSYSDKNFLAKYPYGLNFRTKAALYGSEFINAGVDPIIYNGYSASFNNYRQLGKYKYEGSSSGDQFVLYTRGGAPLSVDNWIVSYVEYNIASKKDLVDDKPSSSIDSNYVYDETTNSYILTLYIHLFFPDGSYVRTILDRSDKSFDSEICDKFELCYWLYEDYANTAAELSGKTFTSEWNKIRSGQYVQYGNPRNQNGSEDPNKNLLFNWNNGKGINFTTNKAVSKSYFEQNSAGSPSEIFNDSHSWGGGMRNA